MTTSNQNLQNIWNEYYPKVYGYFFKRVDNKTDVEDLTSITMERYLNIFIDEQKAVRVTNKHAYLWKIANNQLADFITSKQKRFISLGLNDDISDLNLEAEKQYSSRYEDKISCLSACIKESLKDPEAKIVEMSFLEEMTSVQIGNYFGITPENVRKKISRSITKLKTACRDIWAACNH
jgi:RNA polymerase sigma factor (sigma-70 family)